MPVCENCTRVKNLYTCANEITISEVDPEISVNVFFESAATGKVIVITAESNISGEVIFPLEFEPLADSDYKVWLQEVDTNVDTPLTVTIEDIEVTCFYVRFERIYGSDNVTITGLDQTFELA